MHFNSMFEGQLQDLTQWSREAVGSDPLKYVLESGMLRRVRQGLGGSHTVVTYPPLDSLEALEPVEVTSRVGPVKELNVYVHIAFCEYICGYCHYDTARTALNQGDPRRTSYIRALTTELARWREYLGNSALGSVYIGGGTPTVLPESDLSAILGYFDSYRKTSKYQVCLETSPVTASSNEGMRKLTNLVATGIQRISIGVQTFSNALLLQHRGHELRTVLCALTHLLSLNVEVNVDLVQDLPGQDDQSIIEDVLWINSFRPHQVTWYILRLHSGSLWHKSLDGFQETLADSVESVRRRLLIRRAMEIIGYVARPGGRFMRNTSSADHYKALRSQNDACLVGMGASAYSHGWGYFFRNGRTSGSGRGGVNNYIQRIQDVGLAIQSGLLLDTNEIIAGTLVSGIRSGVQIPSTIGGAGGYLERARETVASLQQLDLVTRNSNDFYALSDAGCLFEEEICSLFYSDRTRRVLGERTMTRASQRLVEIST